MRTYHPPQRQIIAFVLLGELVASIIAIPFFRALFEIVCRSFTTVFTISSAIALLLPAPVLSRYFHTRTYWIASPDGIEEHRFFFSPRNASWRDIQSVITAKHLGVETVVLQSAAGKTLVELWLDEPGEFAAQVAAVAPPTTAADKLIAALRPPSNST